jgi:ubiquinone/menaquinone biosynthesis C-methylase UbiE
MHPRGVVGHLVGWEMALRPSNRKRNVWAVSLLGVQPTDRILEIGFGPGIAIGDLARRATHGHVVGVDRSEVMRAQAARRNAAAIRAGRVLLTVAPVENLPKFEQSFDKVLAVNNMGMRPEPTLRLKELARLMRGAGQIALVSQPRHPGATAETTRSAARDIVGKLEDAGFVDISVETLDLDPPVACVIGTVPNSREGSSSSDRRRDRA